MSDIVRTQGPAVDEDRLIEFYRAQRGVPSPWVGITDQVMGGISAARVTQCERDGSIATCLTGHTRLENNGGFVQMKLDVGPAQALANFRGLFLELCGPVHAYNLHIKTSQLDKPWQSYRYTLQVEPQWVRFHIPYAELQPHRTDVELDVSRIKSIAVVAIGQAFDVDVCVRRAGVYR